MIKTDWVRSVADATDLEALGADPRFRDDHTVTVGVPSDVSVAKAHVDRAGQ